MPIWFEITPPSRRATDKRVETFLSTVTELCKKLPHLEAINLPEILDENFSGQPYYRNCENREFGGRLRKGTGKEIIVNKVVVHEPNFSEWAHETKEKFNVNKVILVGGTYEHVRYPGPSVLAANEIAAKHGLTVGNICIPDRPKEEQRMLAKIKTGTSFFTTQVLYESAATKYLLRELQELLEKERRKPPTIYLSYAPVGDQEDIEFLKWLGVVIPPYAEEDLFRHPDVGATSLTMVQKIHEEILEFCKTQRITIPLGINVEQISSHNLDLACKMAALLSPLC